MIWAGDESSATGSYQKKLISVVTLRKDLKAGEKRHLHCMVSQPFEYCSICMVHTYKNIKKIN